MDCFDEILDAHRARISAECRKDNTIDSCDYSLPQIEPYCFKQQQNITSLAYSLHQPPLLRRTAIVPNNLHPLCFQLKCMKKKQRNDKNPIPNEQKDDKYFEKRKRNNEAAKKSRDARKMREDRIALKAALLERENSILRSQMFALQEEVYALAQILCFKTATQSVKPSH